MGSELNGVRRLKRRLDLKGLDYVWESDLFVTIGELFRDAHLQSRIWSLTYTRSGVTVIVEGKGFGAPISNPRQGSIGKT